MKAKKLSPGYKWREACLFIGRNIHYLNSEEQHELHVCVYMV